MATSVSIIICTRDRSEHLRRTMASVAELEVPDGINPELFVVDNASQDGTADVVRRTKLPNMPVHLIREKQPGLSHARNAALAATRGDIILFTDDDVRLPKNWIDGMCRPILRGEADAVAGKVELAPHLQRPWMEPFHRATLASTDLIGEDAPGVMMGASMGFSRKVLEKVPGFDPELGAGAIGTAEDTLFAWQLLEAGYRIALVPDVVVEHRCDESRLSRAAFISAAKKLGRSYSYIYYHWEHNTQAHWRRDTGIWPWIVLLKRSLRWVYWRVVRWQACQAHEGIERWEFYLIMNIYNIRQHLRERRRPRLYDKRGLVKHSADTGR